MKSDTPRTDAAAVGFARLLVDRDKRITTELVDANFARQLERELAAAQAEIADLTEELADKRKFCYAVELALDGLKGDYVKIINKLRKDAERYRWLRARPVEDCTTPRIEVCAWDCNVNDDGVSDSVNDGSVLAGDALDAAIDTAIREKK